MYSRPIVNAGIGTAAAGAPASIFSVWLAVGLLILGALMVLGSMSATSNFFPRLAFEPHQKTDRGALTITSYCVENPVRQVRGFLISFTPSHSSCILRVNSSC